MREKIANILENIFFIGIVSILLLSVIFSIKNNLNKTEQIKSLEQSLNEQLAEKEVYMRMLEEGYDNR